jgi:hypothetical protein
MSFDEVCEQNAVFNLMTAIGEDLVNPTPLFQRPPGFQVGIQGQLAINDVAAEATYAASCMITASTNWRRVPLKVFCTEKWMKQEIDWHQIKEKSGSWHLCYEFPERWKDRITAVQDCNDASKVIEFAARFCIHGARWLLEKHLFAHRHNITNWPTEWPAYAHGFEAARHQYRLDLLRAG